MANNQQPVAPVEPKPSLAEKYAFTFANDVEDCLFWTDVTTMLKTFANEIFSVLCKWAVTQKKNKINLAERFVFRPQL